jgi:glutaredoxin
MHKILIFGKEDCQFTKKAIDSIRNNCIFIPTGIDYEVIDEPFRSIIKERRHVTSPCIFRIKYLGGNKDLIEFHNRKGEKGMTENDYVIFGRDTCPYTVDSIQKIIQWRLNYTYIRVPSIPNNLMANYYFDMATSLHHRTAPCIFIVQYIGKCSDLIRLNERLAQKALRDNSKHAKAVEYVEKINSPRR